MPQSPTTSFTFQSPHLSEALSLFECFYGELFEGRRLTHAYQLSTVELRLRASESSNSYTFSSTALQASILLLYNAERTSFTVGEIADALGVTLDALVPHLSGIAKTKMVKLSSEAVELETVATFNPKFFSKKPKFALPIASDPGRLRARESSEEGVGVGVDVNADRLERVEAAIVHAMKARKVLGFSALQDEVRTQLAQRFLVTPKIFKKAAEALVEKGYIERSSDNRDTFKYVS